MKNKTEKLYFVVVMTLFSFIALFHFVRLSAGWEVPTLVSGFIIVVSLFVVYWSWLTFGLEEKEEKELHR